MRASIPLAAILILSALSCADSQGSADAAAKDKAVSVYTSLKTKACTEEIDPDDPNDTRYQVCPGAGGYQLQVRPVESGRTSIVVVAPSKKSFPLNFEDVVTRSMDSVDDRVEWRVRTVNGNAVPVALIVGVAVHDWRDPEKVTKNYWVVAKITPSAACVTDRFSKNSKSLSDLQAAADAAVGRACAKRLRSTAAKSPH